MKFEDFLMEPSEEKKKKLVLEEEIKNLKTELDGEQERNRVLHSALQGPVLLQPCLSLLLPPQVQVLLAELAAVEEEIIWLERKINGLKMRLYNEKKQNQQWKQTQQQQQHSLIHRQGYISVPHDDIKQRSRSQNYEVIRKGKMKSYRRSSIGSSTDILSTSSLESIGESYERSRRLSCRIRNQSHTSKEVANEKPNTLSEELLKCLIDIFLELNQAPEDQEGSAIIPKLSLSCMNPKGFMAKTSFNCKAPSFPFNHNASNIDPYGILPDLDGIVRDIGPYKNFIQITKVSILDQHLQCLYNACTAFLEHGLPSTQDKLLTVMNKAALNVGGIVLNALAIEHFILRHPCESTNGPMDEKEMLLRHAYGLGYPEPNVTFALCRGSWSSPALRVYTSDEVVNELGRARVEYLQASVGVTNKRKIIVPKLLQWHMQDFADDMESLLEWIYSQLPRSGSLKTLIMECLNRETKSPVKKIVEVQPYEFEFRYLLPL
ncbi:hypothetical protein SLEP1_g5750 [Rubroshorea leprosula]|uniref:Ternary complex factor MIP1 leucine-zipper domain-containing protein n=2 Tax=Rubroshorea leprosula TaxID=152421 RepID=A0AAV5I2J6_9ROSI|nr:hypothetical protein SLEP1_g5750 [Rubroshorea leprosula]